MMNKLIAYILLTFACGGLMGMAIAAVLAIAQGIKIIKELRNNKKGERVDEKNDGE